MFFKSRYDFLWAALQIIKQNAIYNRKGFYNIPGWFPFHQDVVRGGVAD